MRYIIILALACAGCAGLYEKKYEREAREIEKLEETILDMEGDAALDGDIELHRDILAKLVVVHEKTEKMASEEQARNQAVLLAFLTGGVSILTALAGKVT